MAGKITAADCVVALRAKYDSDAYALFEQVPNGTGWRNKGWADAVVFSLWPSRGLTLAGIEIKVHRSDWIKELKSPAKSVPVQQYCDHWWVVAPKGIVKKEELPPTWGLQECTGKKLKVIVSAPKLEAKPIDRAFLAALLRRASESQQEMLRAEYTRGREEGAASGAGEIASRLAWAEKRYKEVEARITQFEAASGVRLTPWRVGEIGDAVRVLTDAMERNRMAKTLEAQCVGLERALAAGREELKVLKSLEERVTK